MMCKVTVTKIPMSQVNLIVMSFVNKYCKDSNITPGGYMKISSDFEGGYIRGGLYSNLYSNAVHIACDFFKF